MRRLWGSEIKKKNIMFSILLLLYFSHECSTMQRAVNGQMKSSLRRKLFFLSSFSSKEKKVNKKKKDKLFQSNILKISCAMQSSYFSIPIHGDFYNLSGRPSGPPTSSSH